MGIGKGGGRERVMASERTKSIKVGKRRIKSSIYGSRADIIFTNHGNKQETEGAILKRLQPTLVSGRQHRPSRECHVRLYGSQKEKIDSYFISIGRRLQEEIMGNILASTPRTFDGEG